MIASSTTTTTTTATTVCSRARGRAWVAVAALVLAACSGSTTLPAEVTAPPTVPPVVPVTVAPPACTNEQVAQSAVRSYPSLSPMPSPGAMPAGSTMAAIQARGRLKAGVSADTLLFGARNALTGDIEGFDIDMLKEVALAIFGPGGDQKIEYHVIRYDQRLPELEAKDVDLVAHTMTINCNRWLRIGFSTEYFHAGQKVLVRKGSGFKQLQDLTHGSKVCAPKGSTNIDFLENDAKAKGVVVVGKDDISDCLVAMQQGSVDAISGDDTVLAGFAAQDPSTEVVGPQFTDEPYGLGANAQQVDLIRFVNGVLDQVRSSGRWTAIYQHWLIDTRALQPPIPAPPTADTTRPVPGS
jgi:polar amino acid transport system substrate-binding protein